jgi:hypothetical protein
MDASINFSLSFEGSESDEHRIDFYDVSQALIGFQRSLALTSHLVINGQIITQSPSLKGARIYVKPPEDGSWKVTAVVLAGTYAVATAPMDTPLGHVIHSAYDYVVSESLGYHVDYDKSLLELHEEHAEQNLDTPKIEQHQLDSLIEKCSTAIKEIHRPIFQTESATSAVIESTMSGQKRKIGGTLDLSTYEYIHEEFVSDLPVIVSGRVSSYNSNTFKGRIYVASEGRPVAFQLSENCRDNQVVQLIVASLSVNAVKDYENPWSSAYCRVFKNTSRSGHLKNYTIVEVSNEEIYE